ncbi:mechanosensitive ion channel family protein [Aestuariibacter sp. AA17]|uniref:Mechanosensitive ion channel family protein n=1 Tax=Fluctibacter corallii TaxID=2984329 RepID=A0ABT3AA08_9ALTE|nr:mechanosensitive ion channel family protein [Aestuariibacter sp. AA17]MCV2885151.1 mechanosensitive ion channel family protein [Aestuariibacter sp. AA17]
MSVNEIEALLLQTFAFFAEHRLLTSIIIVILALGVKRLVVRRVRKRSTLRGEDRRHQINTFKQLYNASIIIFLLILWSSEVQSFAISIAAFTVAIVLATKEFIQCFLGFIYYLGARPFRVGDWVQLNNQVVGEVVEIDWAKVALLEVDAESFEYTGKHLYVPNSHIVTQMVKNLNFLRRYSMHEFSVTLEPTVNIYPFMDEVLEAAIEHCQHFKDVAERYKGLIERNLDVEFITIDPQIVINTNQYAKVVVSVSLFCPTKEAFTLQQKITQDLMARVFEAQEAQVKLLHGTVSTLPAQI